MILELLRMVVPSTQVEIKIFLITLFIGLFYIFLRAMVRKYLAKDKRIFAEMDKLPGPPLQPILGNAMEFMIPSTKYLGLVHNLIEQYGRVIRIWMLNVPYVMLASAKDFEKVLSSPAHVEKSRDYFAHKPWLGNALNLAKRDEWLARRRLLNPSFQFRFLDGFMQVFNEQSTILKNIFMKEAAETGEKVDVLPYASRCTFDIICESAMGTKVEAQSKKDVDYLNNIISISSLVVERMLRPWFHPDFLWNISPQGKRAKKIIDVLVNFTEKIIAGRRKLFKEIKESKESSDTESTFDGQDDDNDLCDKKKPQHAFLDLLLEMQETHGKKFLSDSEIRNETDLFMVAGHETSGSSMAWTMFMLASHQKIQEKLHKELDEVFEGDKDRPVTIADFGKLKYLDMCMKEGLRICPPIPVIFRHIHQDIPLENGTMIPRGTSVALNILELQRDPTVFKDPMTFDPERFRPENCIGRSAYAYVPFAAGPRNCIGIRFAQMEGKVILATLLRHFKLETDQKFEEIEISPDISLRPKNGLRLKFTRRE